MAGCAHRQHPFCAGVLWRDSAGRRPRLARAFIHDAARTPADHLRPGLDEITFPFARRLAGYSRSTATFFRNNVGAANALAAGFGALSLQCTGGRGFPADYLAWHYLRIEITQ